MPISKIDSEVNKMLTQKKNETCPFKDLVQEWDEDDGYIIPSYVRAARTAMNVARRITIKRRRIKMNVLSLFDGISCGRLALERAGIHVDNYFASEIDPYALSISRYHYPDTIQLGDVRGICGRDLPKIDLLIGGSPCQGFSVARGKDTKDDPRNKLVFEFARIKDTIDPDNFLFENVVMSQEEQQIISDALGVEPILINSDLFVPQNRPRLYWTDIKIEKLPPRPEWNYQFWQYRRNYWRENKSGVCPCLTANMGTGGNNVPYIMDKDQRRVLSCEELEGLQSLPFGYTFGVCTSRRRKMIGDCWTVDVIAHILKGDE